MFRSHLPAWLIMVAGACSQPPDVLPDASLAPDSAETASAPVMSLSGQPLRPPQLANATPLEADLAMARSTFEAAPDDPDALIWVARRLGYLWRYREALALLDEGVARWPDNAKLYRHRGHRYITVREFARAQADLEKAAALVAGQPDEIEPDGQPNRLNQPRTTLAFNIWYHLGLAHYLQGDYEQALVAYDALLASGAADNDDARVAVTDWMWMSLMRLGRREEATRLLDAISPDMTLLENDSYLRRLLMYKGMAAPEALLDPARADATDLATQGYGVANYHLVHGRTEQARAVLEKILAGAGWSAFGYIAAEADLMRMQRAAPPQGADATTPPPTS